MGHLMFSRQFSSIEALYVGCEHGYTGVLAKVCTEGFPHFPQGIELHFNEIIVDISIDKYSNFCDKFRKHTLLWILLEAIIMLGLWNSRGHTT